ncbi:ABC transporter permease [Actinoallomurus purpureus]|uniref:ABC transporter permease n=1 Tax=Actinoallomurus purpureus TaxID=478114 RepID=UPI0020925BB5|nr:ABC transporter permease [Actinoallomurus purpureus]MCO6009741.1 ABC transporter permease [Actinoallomurus purpureus]
MSRRSAGLLLVPGIALLAFGFVFPVCAMLLAPPEGDAAGVAGRLGGMLTDGYVLSIALRTVRIGLITMLASLLLGFPVAYAISRAPARRAGVLLALSTFPLLLSTVVRTYSWLVILGRNGLLSGVLTGLGITAHPPQLLYTETAIVLGLVQLFTPLMILSCYGSLSQVDSRLEEAARGLGASSGRAFRLVVLPMALPGVAVGSTLVFAGAVTAFTTPMLLGGTRQRTLATLLYDYASVSLDWTSASAVAVFMTMIVLAVGVLTGRVGASRLGARRARKVPPATAGAAGEGAV